VSDLEPPPQRKSQAMTRRDCLRTSAAAVASWALPPVLRAVDYPTATHPSTAPASQAASTQPAPFVLSWGSRGAGEGQFDPPIGLAIKADEIYVTDFRNRRVQWFDTQGKFLGSIKTEGQAAGIALNAAGQICVSQFSPEQVSVYTRAGELVRKWGKMGTAEGEFNNPGGIAIAKDGSIYVADQTNRRVQKFDPQGKFLLKWGEYGVKPGQFGGNCPPNQRVGGPHFLAFDSQGNIYTTEGSVGRIQKFTPDGKFLHAFGDNSTGPGGFGGREGLQGPIGICIDRQDRIWVSATNHRVQQFTADGKYLRGFGSLGTGAGQFKTPHMMVIDSRGFLYVADANNCRIQKFAV
jgi:sugar lactone lactonase YvrE